MALKENCFVFLVFWCLRIHDDVSLVRFDRNLAISETNVFDEDNANSKDVHDHLKPLKLKTYDTINSHSHLCPSCLFVC